MVSHVHLFSSAYAFSLLGLSVYQMSETKTPTLFILLSIFTAIIMLVLNSYVSFKVKKPYMVVMAVTIIMTCYLVLHTYTLLVQGSQWKYFTAVLLVLGLVTSVLMILGRNPKKRNVK